MRGWGLWGWAAGVLTERGIGDFDARDYCTEYLLLYRVTVQSNGSV